MTVTKALGAIVVNNSVGVGVNFGITGEPALSGGLASNINAGQQWRYDGTTGPAVTKEWDGLVTLIAGALTLDLTALVDAVVGTVTMVGLKLRFIHLIATATNANPITVAPGAVNGYTGWAPSGGVTLETANDQILMGPLNGGVAVSASVKTLDFSGTGTQSMQVILGFGT